MAKNVSKSEFYMWRALFAFAFSDNIVTEEEKQLLVDYRGDVQFSDGQLETLRNDYLHPQDVNAMYQNIIDPEFKHKFCALARALAWCDGDLTKQEERILKRVTCLKDDSEKDTLTKSRTHPELYQYYEQYTKNGMAGFMQPPPLVALQA